jgi:hypothetical protein
VWLLSNFLASLLGCRAAQLKRIYKASQEKKSVVILRVPHGFVFKPYSAQNCDSKTNVCDRTL